MKISSVTSKVDGMRIIDVLKALAVCEAIEGAQSDVFEQTYSAIYDRVLEHQIEAMSLAEVLNAYCELSKDEDTNLRVYLETRISNEMNAEDFRAVVLNMLKRNT